MAIYIALLRGINVGGKNKIKMAELKHTLESIGMSRVQTYIQSGNVLFESEEGEEALRGRIEREIESAFGFAVPVVMRALPELERLVSHCPFSDEAVRQAEANSGVESLYAAFLIEAPPQHGIERLAAANNANDEYRIEGRDVYLLFWNSVRNSKLAVNLQKLGVPATVRNWNTVNKLIELARAMKG